MKLIQTNLPCGIRDPQSLTAAKVFFKGIFIRLIPFSIYDTQDKRVSYGILYVASGSVLFSMYNTKTRAMELYELEKNDTFEATNISPVSLAYILTQRDEFQQTLSVKTSSPINYIVFNSRYILYVDMDNNMNTGFGKKTMSLRTIILTGKDYITKNSNLITTIKEILEGNYSTSNVMSLPGISPKAALFNRYAIYVFVLFFIFVFFIIIFSSLRR